MAMNTEKKIYVALGVLVVMGGGLYLQQRHESQDAAQHSAAATAANLPEIKLAADDADKVTKIEIHNADKGDVVLEKQADKWTVTKPVSYAANQQNVKSLIDNLKELKLKDTIDPGESQYATYELDGPKAVHVEVFKGNDKALDLFFGKSGSRGQMTRIAGKPGVYVASGYSGYLYTRELKNWRDNEIFKFEDANVVSVDIENEHGTFGFSKNGDAWTGSYKKSKIDDFDAEKVKDMIRAYKALTAEDFADDKSDADTGLDKPLATVSFTLKDNGGTFKLMVGKSSSGSSHYAKKDGANTGFVISSWASDWATAAVSKFQKASDKDAGADGGKKK